MRTQSRFLFQLITGLLLFTGIAYADEPARTNDIRFTFIEPPIVPASDLPRDARHAGVTPDPQAKKDKASDIEFGIVRDPSDHGALSNIVADHITAIAVSWTDTNRFKTHQQTETLVRRLLTSPTGSYTGSYCHTFTYVVWSQVLGRPSIAARVEHANGKSGQLLLFASGPGDYYFAYKDGQAKWWFGQWREAVQK